MQSDLTPFQVLERLIGPPPELSRIVGHSRTAAYNWRMRAPGDVPTPAAMRRLLAHSDAHGLGLTADHLIRGASLAEIEAILAARLQTGVAAE